MKYSVIAASLAVSAAQVLAQSSYIPSGISTTCSAFLGKLDTDTGLAACTSGLVQATKAFQSSTSNATSTDVTSAVTVLCSSGSCSDSHIRGLLSQFYTACSDDVNKNADVKSAYDLLYLISPFRSALCATDSTSSQSCVNTINSNSNKSKRSLEARADSAASSNPKVDGSSLSSSGLPYLFITKDTASDKLCTPCTKSILQSYISFESQLPYGLGISQSPILGGQADVVDHVKSTCGADFFSTITKNTGSDPLGALGKGAASSTAVLNTLGATFIGAASIAVALLA